MQPVHLTIHKSAIYKILVIGFIITLRDLEQNDKENSQKHCMQENKQQRCIKKIQHFSRIIVKTETPFLWNANLRDSHKWSSILQVTLFISVKRTTTMYATSSKPRVWAFLGLVCQFIIDACGQLSGLLFPDKLQIWSFMPKYYWFYPLDIHTWSYPLDYIQKDNSFFY